jgi:ketosteroid isomerase-like protein
MSQENVEVVRASFEAWNRNDFDAWIQYFDPEVQWSALLEGCSAPSSRRGDQARTRKVCVRFVSDGGRLDAMMAELRLCNQCPEQDSNLRPTP